MFLSTGCFTTALKQSFWVGKDWFFAYAMADPQPFCLSSKQQTAHSPSFPF